MSREVYTYTDLTKLNSCKNCLELLKYPQITVSADLRKCLTGNPEVDKVKGLFADVAGFRATEFHSFASAIDEVWSTDQSKFREMILLSEFMRGKLLAVEEGTKEHHWLVGCMRNIDSMLSAIIMLEQADVRPEDIKPNGDRNLELFVEAWKMLIDKDTALAEFRTKMKGMNTKAAWKNVFKKSMNLDSVDDVSTIVFHGFYYITPHQERIMRLLEESGFQLIFLIPYDERYPYAYEIWDETYAEKRGYVPKSQWHIERSCEDNAYGEIFEGRKAEIHNRLEIKEYASIMEFVDAVKHIREKGFSFYSADYKSANQILKDYFPESYGDRKILSYPIGQFIGTLNRMWDEENETIAIDEESLIECFSSGWLSVDGVSGKQYMQDLMYVLPFFHGCHSIEEWEKRIAFFREIEESVIGSFESDLDADMAVSRWQEAIGSPLKNFSMFAVESEKLDIILKLIKQLLDMAKELFGRNSLVSLQDHIRTLDGILKKHELSQELYDEERELVSDIFEKLGSDNEFNAICHPADIARALDLFICGHFEEGEIQTNRVGLIYPLYFIDAACVKNRSKVHICMSDVNSLPGSDKDYIWPLTGKKMREIYKNTGKPLIANLIQIMESTIACNRYFTYCALRNKEVTISWVSSMGEKLLAPSPYIKLLLQATGTELKPAARNSITYNRVAEALTSEGRVAAYDNGYESENETETIRYMVKEARMDYALCPMKYILGYVLEKYPTYQSDFQMNYALNAFISAIYNLTKEQGMTIDQAYDAVVALFPNMRKVEKRQVYDYISYDRKEDDLDYGNRTECGEKFYTDERLKIHYPNQEVRAEAIARFGKLGTPNGRKGLELNKSTGVTDACVFCQHISYCRNAVYAGDQENYYD